MVPRLVLVPGLHEIVSEYQVGRRPVERAFGKLQSSLGNRNGIPNVARLGHCQRMSFAWLLRALVGLLPALCFLGALLLLDSYKLVRLRMSVPAMRRPA